MKTKDVKDLLIEASELTNKITSFLSNSDAHPMTTLIALKLCIKAMDLCNDNDKSASDEIVRILWKEFQEKLVAQND